MASSSQSKGISSGAIGVPDQPLHPTQTATSSGAERGLSTNATLTGAETGQTGQTAGTSITPITNAPAPARSNSSAILPATDAPPNPSAPTEPIKPGDAATIRINLLLTTGSRHPFTINLKFLNRRDIKAENNDPWNISVYDMKSLIWHEWFEEWDTRPTSPGSIRLIFLGGLLDDKLALKDCRLNRNEVNVVHMTVKPQDTHEEEEYKSKEQKGSGSNGRSSSGLPVQTGSEEDKGGENQQSDETPSGPHRSRRWLCFGRKANSSADSSRSTPDPRRNADSPSTDQKPGFWSEVKNDVRAHHQRKEQQREDERRKFIARVMRDNAENEEQNRRGDERRAERDRAALEEPHLQRVAAQERAAQQLADQQQRDQEQAAQQQRDKQQRRRRLPGFKSLTNTTHRTTGTPGQPTPTRQRLRDFFRNHRPLTRREKDDNDKDSKDKNDKGDDKNRPDSKDDANTNNDTTGNATTGNATTGHDAKGSDSDGNNTTGNDSRGNDSNGSNTTGNDSRGNDYKGKGKQRAYPIRPDSSESPNPFLAPEHSTGQTPQGPIGPVSDSGFDSENMSRQRQLVEGDRLVLPGEPDNVDEDPDAITEVDPTIARLPRITLTDPGPVPGPNGLRILEHEFTIESMRGAPLEREQLAQYRRGELHPSQIELMSQRIASAPTSESLDATQRTQMGIPYFPAHDRALIEFLFVETIDHQLPCTPQRALERSLNYMRYRHPNTFWSYFDASVGASLSSPPTSTAAGASSSLRLSPAEWQSVSQSFQRIISAGVPLLRRRSSARSSSAGPSAVRSVVRAPISGPSNAGLPLPELRRELGAWGLLEGETDYEVPHIIPPPFPEGPYVSPSTESTSISSGWVGTSTVGSPVIGSPRASTEGPSTAVTAPAATTAPSTEGPSTAAPSTAGPSTAAPSTTAPSAMAPSTVAPSTTATATVVPAPAAPAMTASVPPAATGYFDMGPSTAGPPTTAGPPVAGSSTTAGPPNTAPATAAPATAAPVTAAPVPPPATDYPTMGSSIAGPRAPPPPGNRGGSGDAHHDSWWSNFSFARAASQLSYSRLFHSPRYLLKRNQTNQTNYQTPQPTPGVVYISKISPKLDLPTAVTTPLGLEMAPLDNECSIRVLSDAELAGLQQDGGYGRSRTPISCDEVFDSILMCYKRDVALLHASRPVGL
ncbi:hypothetical protein BT63DRAFT_480819 [Microthyrium microscopicum]|uniref:UBL3-like ubiquitin domain-containing protein n=1 Tax=Microthyrium microscopicum TaxID=703497 RepID=A0A6A6U8Z3_9PEZI|nr:hypothetical protein BT63DRAFT_480819 [Microthyrium microscopicum]